MNEEQMNQEDWKACLGILEEKKETVPADDMEGEWEDVQYKRNPNLSEINSYLQTYANPLNIRAEQGLSPGGTAGGREVTDDYDL